MKQFLPTLPKKSLNLQALQVEWSIKVPNTHESKKIAIIPGGAWGLGFGQIAAEKGHNVSVYTRSASEAAHINRTRISYRKLPGILLNDRIQASSYMEEVLEGADILVLASPVLNYRELFREVKRYPDPRRKHISLTKGIESHSNMRMTQILEDEQAGISDSVAVLSGYNIASDIARGEKSAAADLAAFDLGLAQELKKLFELDRFEIKTTADVAGVEFGGALKNVIAIAAGMSDGSRGTAQDIEDIITEGLGEMISLGTALGAHWKTFYGYSGEDDLRGSIFGKSRNYHAGLQLAQGATFQDLTSGRTTYEGVHTVGPAVALARQNRIATPRMDSVHQALFSRTLV